MLEDLAWSKSSAVRVSVLDGTLKRSIKPGSAAEPARRPGVRARRRIVAGLRGLRAARGRLPVLRRAVLTVDSGVVPMTRTSGRVTSVVDCCASANPGSSSAPNESTLNIRAAPDALARSRPPHETPRIALDRHCLFPKYPTTLAVLRGPVTSSNSDQRTFWDVSVRTQLELATFNASLSAVWWRAGGEPTLRSVGVRSRWRRSSRHD